MARPFTLALLAGCIVAAGVYAGSVVAADAPEYDGELSGFEYAYPVERFTFSSQGRKLQMAYLDIQPETDSANGRTVVLMHGKNFCAGTWEDTIAELHSAGYRVIAPDQVGFCKSSKPEHYQFSFHQLAANSRALLEELEVDNVTVMGHSMGGMLATRFALMYPEYTEQLVMVNPIGLEDWKALGVPYQSIDDGYQAELRKTAESIRAYQQSTYYVNTWEPEYDRWVEMSAGMYAGKDKERVAWNQALTSDMVFTQPVVHEFGQLQMPTLLLIGEKDNTAIGKALAPKDIQKTLGRYDVLGKQAAEAIPQATLVEFTDLGHSPQIQQQERFHKALLEGLERR
ncbi:Pimeloyl-ACP methyl ester carboxylesterase [Halopseudomonas litoralis]|uniref:Pimeloyl-ACP methyl ester carboxylesterase n=1 Tax=Halopseudomonas litoralis TaxID=797277 RepID=A0A1H1M4M5_9GAMM|nr:alpha/beta hydrolase [Halopseudomonas litoralis]SDR81686.1 Pimeloyl-ACP methyl ester carboxylesterase [Halopseudomonas litoralis]